MKKERVLHKKCVSLFEYESLGLLFDSESEFVNFLLKKMKNDFEKNRPKIYDYSPNFIFEYDIIIGAKTYVFYETSGKKE